MRKARKRRRKHNKVAIENETARTIERIRFPVDGRKNIWRSKVREGEPGCTCSIT